MKRKKLQKIKQIKEIYDEVLNLKKSPLYKYRFENKYVPVIGEGSLDAKIMFVGEAPGKNEALTGKPFCGRSGKILDELLMKAKLKRKDVYVTNIILDRPQKDRDPTNAEVDIYSPFLDRQIDIIQPRVIATLGRFPMTYVMKKFGIRPINLVKFTIKDVHGNEFKVKTKYGDIHILPLYHPAATIYNQSLKEIFFKDGLKLKKYVR